MSSKVLQDNNMLDYKKIREIFEHLELLLNGKILTDNDQVIAFGGSFFDHPTWA